MEPAADRPASDDMPEKERLGFLRNMLPDRIDEGAPFALGKSGGGANVMPPLWRR
jgi:hypothetical protein